MSRSLRGNLPVEDVAFDHRLHPYLFNLFILISSFLHSSRCQRGFWEGRSSLQGEPAG